MERKVFLITDVCGQADNFLPRLTITFFGQHQIHNVSSTVLYVHLCRLVYILNVSSSVLNINRVKKLAGAFCDMGIRGLWLVIRLIMDHGTEAEGRQTRDIMSSGEITDKGKWKHNQTVCILYNVLTQMNSPDYDSYSGKTRYLSFDKSLWMTKGWITFWKIYPLIWWYSHQNKIIINRKRRSDFLFLLKDFWLCSISLYGGVSGTAQSVSALIVVAGIFDINDSETFTQWMYPLFWDNFPTHMSFFRNLEKKLKILRWPEEKWRVPILYIAISVTQRFIFILFIFLKCFFFWLSAFIITLTHFSSFTTCFMQPNNHLVSD